MTSMAEANDGENEIKAMGERIGAPGSESGLGGVERSRLDVYSV